MPVTYNTPAEIKYIGNGSPQTFAIPFKAFETSDIEVTVVNQTTGVETLLTNLVDYTLTNVGKPNTNASMTLVDAYTEDGLGAVITPRQAWLNVASNLMTGYSIFIRFDQEAQQPQKFRDLNVKVVLEMMERIVDRLTMNVKAIKNFTRRTVVVNPLDISKGPIVLPLFQGMEDRILVANSTADGIVFAEYTIQGLAALISASGGFLDSNYAYDGFSLRFNQGFTSTDLNDTLEKILILGYSAATISLSASPGQSVREKGNTVASVTLTATTTKKSDPIAAVRFYRAGSLVNTVATPTPGGGSEVYTDNTPFADTMSFYAQVDDDGTTGGPTTVQSNTVTFTYVYPYYYGVGAAGLSGAAIAALTKDIRTNSSSVTASFSPTVQKIYFAYPSAYAALTSILDPNGFEILSSFTVSTKSITGLDATTQSYRVYELTTPTTQSGFSCTFKQ